MALSDFDTRTFPFHRLPTEIKLRVMEFVDPLALMALLRASCATKTLIDQYGESIIRDIAGQQYPEVWTMAIWLFRRGCDFIETELSQVQQAYEGCEKFFVLVRYLDSKMSRDSGLNLDPRDEGIAELDLKESLIEAWIIIKRSRWGILSYMDHIAASIRRVISKLAQDQIIVRDQNSMTNGLWVLLEKDKCRPDTSNNSFARSKYRTADIERAVYLFWKLHYLLVYSADGHHFQRISNQDRVEYLNHTSPKTRKFLQLLAERIAFELSQRPALRAFTHHCDPSRVNEVGLSEGQESRRKRRELVIRREKEYLVVSHIILLGPRILDSYSNNEDGFIPGESLLREEFIFCLLEKDSRLTEEESQAAWEKRDLVHLGLLSKDPDTRLMMGLDEWRDIRNQEME